MSPDTLNAKTSFINNKTMKNKIILTISILILVVFQPNLVTAISLPNGWEIISITDHLASARLRMGAGWLVIFKKKGIGLDGQLEATYVPDPDGTWKVKGR